DDYTDRRAKEIEKPSYSLISEEESVRKKMSINIQWEEEEVEMKEADFELKKAIIYNEILNRKYE
ncbi:MAG: hypothetical protein K2I47_06465, partial [Odoribacter sp.]|nr:hypothetical protein [Odoribacter sp.]